MTAADQSWGSWQCAGPLTVDDSLPPLEDNPASLAGESSVVTAALLDTKGRAVPASICDVASVRTTTHAGPHGPAGSVLTGIDEKLRRLEAIDRVAYFTAMPDVSFADAVRATGRHGVLPTGVTTDFLLVHPEPRPAAEEHRVRFVTGASGGFTKKINDRADLRIVQKGATSVSNRAVVGDLRPSDSVKDLTAPAERQPALSESLPRYTPAPAVLSENASAHRTPA